MLWRGPWASAPKPVPDRTRKRSALRRILPWAVLTVLLATSVGWLYLWAAQSRRADRFLSCRNHTHYVGYALDRYVAEHGQLPYVPGLPGDELVCRLNFGGAAVSCHAGGGGVGRQMVNASPKSWHEIIQTMQGKVIPVIWCGKPHRPGEGMGTVRAVVAFNAYAAPPLASWEEVLKYGTYVDNDGAKRFDYFNHSIAYRMPEAELKARLAEVNAILRKNGEPETPLNIEGRKDYWRLAEPYQDPP